MARLAADMATNMREFLDGPKRGQPPEETRKEKTLLDSFLEGIQGGQPDEPYIYTWESLEKTLNELKGLQPEPTPQVDPLQEKVDKALDALRAEGWLK